MTDLDENPLLNEFSACIQFSDFTKRLEKIHKTDALADRERKFKRLIDSISEFRLKFISERGPEANASFYPILRLLLPKNDTEREAYGLHRKTLGNLFVKALAINKQSERGRKLTGDDATTKGDLGDVVFEVMKDQHLNGTLTIYDVNKCLDQMSTGSTAQVDTVFAGAIREMSALDCKWFTRIILKKLSLRLGFHRIMQLYHPGALDLYNQISLLSRTCEIIESGVAIEEQMQNQGHIEIFKPIRAMLCERGKIADIDTRLGKDDYYVETKMDGERCQIHIQGKNYKYYSRQCHDESTNVFGADSSGGLFSPVLHRLLSGKFESAIFDGEMMVWDRNEERFATKTEKATARFLSADHPSRNPCFCIYDLIYLDGQPLVNLPYAERIRKLRSLVTESPGQLVLCSRVKIRDAEHFLECVNKAFDEREEGVVIKGAESLYLPGKREGGGWFKIKPDYENNLIVDFDLLIIGGYYSEKRTTVHRFLLGVHKKGGDGENGKFYAVASVVHGFSREQRKMVQNKLEPYWQPVRDSKIAGRGCIEWNNAAPNVWIEPKNSIILQIKASDVVVTKTYRTSHSFRFPRVMEIRDDKPWSECCTLSEFEKYCTTSSKSEKLTKRPATINDIGDNGSKQSLKKRKQSEPKTTLNDADDLIDNVCAGKDFCILSAGEYDVNELESIIKKHGGRVVKNPSSKTYACIAGRKSHKVEMAISNGSYNIASADWLYRSFGGNTVLQSLPKFQPLEMIFATPELELKFIDCYDPFGDSYSEQITKEAFRTFSSKMPVDLLPNYTKSELYELEMELWAPQEPPKFFRFLTAQFLPMQRNDAAYLSYELAQFLFTTKAGRILKSADDDNDALSKLTHIFVDENNCDAAQMENVVGTQAKIVSYKWILECCEADRKISDERFIYI